MTALATAVGVAQAGKRGHRPRGAGCSWLWGLWGVVTVAGKPKPTSVGRSRGAGGPVQQEPGLDTEAFDPDPKA